MVYSFNDSLSCSSNRLKRGRVRSEARKFVGNETGSVGNFTAACACNNPEYAANGISNPVFHELKYSGGTRARRVMLKCKHISSNIRSILQAEEDLLLTRKKAKKEEHNIKKALRRALDQSSAAQRQVTTYFASTGSARKKRMHECIARFVFGLNLSARCVEEDAFHVFVESILDAGISLARSSTSRPQASDHVHKPCVAHLQTKLLKEVIFSGQLFIPRAFLTPQPLAHATYAFMRVQEYDRVRRGVQRKLESGRRYGFTLTIDGLTNITGHHVLNIMVQGLFDGENGSIFLKTVDAFEMLQRLKEKNGEWGREDAVFLSKVMIEAIEEVGAENVVQVITDAPSVNVKLWSLIRDKFPGIICGPCGCHKMNLLMGDIGKLPTVAATLKLGCGIVNTVTRSSVLKGFYEDVNVDRVAGLRKQ